MKPQINRCLLLLTTLISLLQLQKSYSQKIDSLWTDAIQEVSAGHYDQAYPFIYQQLAADKAENTDYYYYGIASAVQTGHMDQAFEWLGDYIRQVASPQVSFFRLRYELQPMYKDRRWPGYLDKMQAKLRQADMEKGYDVALKAQLDQLFYLDQKDRILLDPYQKLYADSSKQVEALWDTIARQDSLNLNALERLWARHGWISKKLVGNGVITQWVIIQHADLDIQEKYLPMLKKAADAGDIRLSSLALTIDRIRLAQGKKQLYGSQINRIQWQGKYFNIIDRLEDPGHVDQRRKEMDLGPIKEYAKDFDIDWSVENYNADIKKLDQAEE